MKKIICVFLILTMVFLFSGCGDKSNGVNPSRNSVNNTVNDVLNQQIDEATESEPKESAATESSELSEIEETISEIEENSSDNEKISDEQEYDIDLSKLGKTMVYSEVYNMMVSPDDYIGKKVRMYGKFAVYQARDAKGDPIPEQIYYACVIPDATACCQQGMEFVLAGDYVFPDDYPESGAWINVSGTFETYDENGYVYCHLVNAVFE